MSKIKLLVEIDENKYRHITEMPNTYASEVCEVIRNGTPIDKGDLVMFNLLMETIADKGLPFEEVLLLIDNAKTPTEGDCISRSALKEAIDKDAEDICGIEDVIDYIDNAPTVEPERPKGGTE